MNDLDAVFDLLTNIEQDVLNLPQQMLLAAHQVETGGAGLGAIDSYLGLVTAGEFRTGNGKQPGKGFSGVRIAFPPMIYNSVNWNIVGVNNDVLEFGVRAADGVALAGAGSVVIDHSGITMANNLARLRFLALNGTDFATIYVSSANVFYLDNRIPGSTFGFQAMSAASATGNLSLGEDAALTDRFLVKATRFSSGVGGTAFTLQGTGGGTPFALRLTAYTSGSETPFLYQPEAFSGLTASTEVNDILFNLTHTVQHATGLLAEQSAIKINRPTYSFVGASTITKTSTFTIQGAPTLGTNATFTNSYALWVQAGTAQFDGGIATASISGLTTLALTTLTVSTISTTAATDLVIQNTTAAREIQVTVKMTSGTQISNLLYREDPGKANRVQFYIPPGNAFGAKLTVDSVSATGFEVITDKATSGTIAFFVAQPDTYTGLTAGVETIDVNFVLSHNVQHATGAITTQRAFVIQAPTYSFAGASTITTAITLAIMGPPLAGTLATITTAYALWVQSGEVLLGGGLSVGSGQGAATGEILTSLTGTWTPTFVGSGTAGVFTYTNQVGYYVKLGGLVFFFGRVTISAIGTPPVGTMSINGLPFSSAATYSSAVSFGRISNFNYTAAALQLIGLLNLSDNKVVLFETFDNAAEVLAPAANFTNAACDMVISGFYKY